jgi:hypothetical protein
MFICPRSKFHGAIASFKVRLDRKLIKVGQHPSMVEIASGKEAEYRKLLSKLDFKELKRASGLVAHGVGIGSFVYLRRIFERLVENAHSKAKTGERWDEGRYIESRLLERIELLSDHLPALLVEHRSLYSILSKGIHQLTEEECLSHFPVVYSGITLILDEIIADAAREKQLTDMKKAISTLHQKLAAAKPIETQADIV